ACGLATRGRTLPGPAFPGVRPSRGSCSDHPNVTVIQQCPRSGVPESALATVAAACEDRGRPTAHPAGVAGGLVWVPLAACPVVLRASVSRRDHLWASHSCRPLPKKCFRRVRPPGVKSVVKNAPLPPAVVRAHTSRNLGQSRRSL